MELTYSQIHQNNLTPAKLSGPKMATVLKILDSFSQECVITTKKLRDLAHTRLFDRCVASCV